MTFDLEKARAEVATASTRHDSLARENARVNCSEEILPDALDEIERLRAMIDSSEHIREPPKMVGFDLEKGRAADEALPYPLDAKEIWVSGKGQMHINLPNAPSIFFTLSDLCEFRNLFHGQAAEIERLRGYEIAARDLSADLTKVAGDRDEQAARIVEFEVEIERLRARDRQAAAAIVAMAEGAKQYVLKTHTIMKNVFDEADSLAGYCEELENIVITKDAQIGELEAKNKRVLLELQKSKNRNMCEERVKKDLQQAARIKDLEDALVDARGKLFHQFGDMELDPPGKDDCRIVREMLQAEGKIGPDAKPRSWQITEEKKRALSIILEYIRYDADDDIEICSHAAVLRAMLTEAGQ